MDVLHSVVDQPAGEHGSAEIRVLVHIGMHKTASSWLQTNLFGRADTAFWCWAPENQAPKSRLKPLALRFYTDDRRQFLANEDFDGKRLRRDLALARMPAGRCAIISSPRLSGHPFSNGIDRGAICERIKAVVPEARIFLVIREQCSMILSNYMQYLYLGGSNTIDNFLDPHHDSRVPRLSTDFWKYDRLVRLYMNAFGPDRVLVLPFEMFVEEPQAFVARLCAFAGIETPDELPFETRANVRDEYLSYVGARLLSPWLRSSIGNAFAPSLFGYSVGKTIHTGVQSLLGRIVPGLANERFKRRLLDRIEYLTYDMYRGSNRNTKELTGLDLHRYGYRMPGDHQPSASLEPGHPAHSPAAAIHNL